jgi:hypothetical protein
MRLFLDEPQLHVGSAQVTPVMDDGEGGGCARVTGPSLRGLPLGFLSSYEQSLAAMFHYAGKKEISFRILFSVSANVSRFVTKSCPPATLPGLIRYAVGDFQNHVLLELSYSKTSLSRESVSVMIRPLPQSSR